VKGGCFWRAEKKTREGKRREITKLRKDVDEEALSCEFLKCIGAKENPKKAKVFWKGWFRGGG